MHGPYPIRLGTSGSVPARMRRGDGVLDSNMRRVEWWLRGTWRRRGTWSVPLRRATLAGAVLHGADLTGADLTDSAAEAGLIIGYDRTGRTHGCDP